MDRTLQSTKGVPSQLYPPSFQLAPELPYYTLCGIGTNSRLASFNPTELQAPQSIASRLSGLMAASRTRRNLLRAYTPHLLDKQDLGVLYLGAGFYELADEARWTYIESRLSKAPVPRVYAVGAELTASTLQKTPYIPNEDVPSPLERVFFGTAAAHTSEIHALVDGGAIDVVIFHHPDLWGDQRLLADDTVLSSLLRSGLPFLGTSFNPEDYEFAAAGFASLGSPLENALLNPACHHQTYQEGCNPDVRWGHVLWRVDTNRRSTITERTRCAAMWHAMTAAMEALNAAVRGPTGDVGHLAMRSPCGRYLGASATTWLDLDNAEFRSEDGHCAQVSRDDIEPLQSPIPITDRALAVLEIMRAVDKRLDARLDECFQSQQAIHALPRGPRPRTVSTSTGFFTRD